MNPFLLTNNLDNHLRPYTTGITERHNSIATLVLYTGEIGNVLSVELEGTDFLKDNNKQYVKAINPESNSKEVGQPADLTKDSIPVLNNNKKGLYLGIFNNFSLMQVTEDKDQITKLHQNFGSSWNLFFFGDSPSIYSFNGIFLDTWEYPYYQEFMTMYDRYLSGRQCVENGFKMKISYDGKIIGGYLLKIRTMLSSDTPHSKSFSFTIIVTDEQFMRENMRIAGDQLTPNGTQWNALNNGHRVIRQYPGLLEQGEVYNKPLITEEQRFAVEEKIKRDEDPRVSTAKQVFGSPDAIL